jgi:hypothetical protein
VPASINERGEVCKEIDLPKVLKNHSLRHPIATAYLAARGGSKSVSLHMPPPPPAAAAAPSLGMEKL